jgi:hypothetical protein
MTKTVKLKMYVMLPGKEDMEEREVDCRLDNYGRPAFTQDLRHLIMAALTPLDNYEHVNVFWWGRYLDMFVDEMGMLKGRDINRLATKVYHENVRVHQPDLLRGAESIHGPAVLFDKKVWF